MSLLEFSTNIADATVPDPLPAGEYEAVCTQAVSKESKASGNPMVVLTFKIAKSQFPADFDDGGVDELTLIYNRLTVRDTQQDRFRLKTICTAMGVPMSNKIDINDFVTKTCRLKTMIEKDLEGNDRASIDKILAI